MLGGLITTNSTLDEKGTPFLKDIPLVGPAFRNTTVTQDRTELLVLITAYVLRGQEDKELFTNALIEQFDRAAVTTSRLPTLSAPKNRKSTLLNNRHLEIGGPKASFDLEEDDTE